MINKINQRAKSLEDDDDAKLTIYKLILFLSHKFCNIFYWFILSAHFFYFLENISFTSHITKYSYYAKAFRPKISIYMSFRFLNTFHAKQLTNNNTYITITFPNLFPFIPFSIYINTWSNFYNCKSNSNGEAA